MSGDCTNLTGIQRTVLSSVPASTRPAFKRLEDVRRVLAVEYGLNGKRTDHAFDFLVDRGLIEITTGFCRRTLSGDEALLISGSVGVTVPIAPGVSVTMGGPQP
jgi:hypothetical protein